MTSIGPEGSLTGNLRKHVNRNPVQRFLIQRFHDRVLTAVRSARPSTVLEVGCGEGFVLRYLFERVQGVSFAGVDLNPSAVAEAQVRAEEATVTVGNIYHLPYGDNAFDLVLCLEVLEHLDDPASALEELRRVARDGVLLSVPQEPWFRVANFLRGKNLTRWGDDAEHRQRWRKAEFSALVGHYFRILGLTASFPWLLVWAAPSASEPPLPTITRTSASTPHGAVGEHAHDVGRRRS